MWIPRFACPDCRAPVSPDGSDRFSCRVCAQTFERLEGVYRFLTKRRSDAAEPFQEQYRTVRSKEGRSDRPAEYYRKLPLVPTDDQHRSEWRIRRESYFTLRTRALAAWPEQTIRLLDAGAGNGWLAHRLASAGHAVVALDRLDDDADGLGACRHYSTAFAVVQADFDAMPFESSQFELVVLNGSLHYSPDPVLTLAEARRVLTKGGALAVMDSPMFTDARDGQAMVDDQSQSLQTATGLSGIMHPGVGFLTYQRLDDAAKALGLSARFFPSRGPLDWRVRRLVARFRIGRAPSAFGVWVAR